MTEADLQEIVAALQQKDKSAIVAGTVLDGTLATSFGKARLATLLRSKFNISDPAVYRASTYQDLQAICGLAPARDDARAAAANPPGAPLFPASGNNDLSIGIDAENISRMPETADYWEDPFYKQIFTPREIAYAQLQASPKASFAAMWSAKEAVRKAVSGLIQVDWQRIEVVHDENGRPSIAVDASPLAGSLSLSHTDDTTFAAFVTGSPSRPEPSPQDDAPRATAVLPQPKTSKMPGLLAIVALLVSLIALALSIHR